MFCENVITLIVITIFSQFFRSQFLIDQKKKKKFLVHNIFTLISQKIIGKLLLMDKKVISVVSLF